jgi:hypothetical protein
MVKNENFERHVGNRIVEKEKKNALLPTRFAHSQPNFRKCPRRELSHACVKLSMT